MNKEIDSSDNLFIARKLARFCPTSLSVDDLKIIQSGKKEKNTEKNDNLNYLPPKPNIIIEREKEDIVDEKKTNNRFLNIFKSPKKESLKLKDPPKLIYELPNVKSVKTQLKTLKPIMVVSLSSSNLKELSQNFISNSKKIESDSSDSEI